MEVQVPPMAIDATLQEYLFRQNQIINDALNATNGIAIRDILPNKPRLGKVYYIRGEGLYFYEGDEWLKINTTAV